MPWNILPPVLNYLLLHFVYNGKLLYTNFESVILLFIMPYPQTNYQRLVYGEYPVAKYRIACQGAVRMALVKEQRWKHINSITYTTVGSGHLFRDRFVVVRVKSRASHAKTRLDMCALDNALEGAAESDIDMNRCTHKCKTDMYSVCFEISKDASHITALYE